MSGDGSTRTLEASRELRRTSSVLIPPHGANRGLSPFFSHKSSRFSSLLISPHKASSFLFPTSAVAREKYWTSVSEESSCFSERSQPMAAEPSKVVENFSAQSGEPEKNGLLSQNEPLNDGCQDVEMVEQSLHSSMKMSKNEVDEELALHLKTIAIFLILVTSACGVALPLVGRRLKWLRTDGTVFVLAKAFAAGVILATGFVHMLPDAQEALTDDCLPETPWLKFPFSGFIAMLASFFTLLADFVGTQYYERKHLKDQAQTLTGNPIQEGSWPELLTASSVEDANQKQADALHGDGHMHIVGIHAHAASHRHSHPHGHHSCADETHAHVHGEFGHAHTSQSVSDSSIRHIVVSQVLEMGIVSHSGKAKLYLYLHSILSFPVSNCILLADI